MRVRLGRAPSGDTGEVRGGAGGWARVKSGFIFPILLPEEVMYILILFHMQGPDYCAAIARRKPWVP